MLAEEREYNPKRVKFVLGKSGHNEGKNKHEKTRKQKTKTKKHARVRQGSMQNGSNLVRIGSSNISNDGINRYVDKGVNEVLLQVYLLARPVAGRKGFEAAELFLTYLIHYVKAYMY